MPCPNREPGVLEQNEHRGNVFLENFIYERTTASSGNLDRQEDETLVAGCPLSPDRSHLSQMASEKELFAPLRPVPVDNAEAWVERVLGILTALNHPAVSWCWSLPLFRENFPATSRAAPVPLQGVLSLIALTVSTASPARKLVRSIRR
jgi:hypothetical protein